VIESRVLGSLEVVEDDRQVALGSPKQRALLAALLVHRRNAVSSDRLIDELWGERAPPTARKIVQGLRVQSAQGSATGFWSAGSLGIYFRSIPGKFVRGGGEIADEGDASSLGIAAVPVAAGVASIQRLASIVPTAARAAEAEAPRLRHLARVIQSPDHWSARRRRLARSPVVVQLARVRPAAAPVITDSGEPVSQLCLGQDEVRLRSGPDLLWYGSRLCSASVQEGGWFREPAAGGRGDFDRKRRHCVLAGQVGR
jgi:hypothetical protein